MMEKQGLVKDKQQIELMFKAAAVADELLKAGIKAVKKGAAGADIELAVNSAAKSAGVDHIEKVNIFHGAKLGIPSEQSSEDRPLEEGELVHLEVAGYLNGYAFNCSRVTSVGTPSEEQAAYLEHLAEVVEWMTEVLKPGMKVPFVYTESRGRQIVPSGHGIGTELIEQPAIEINTIPEVVPGTVLCISPMVICNQFGKTTIKNMVLIKDTGAETINKYPLRCFDE